MDANGRLEYLNRRFLELTGLPAAEFYDPEIWHRLVHPEDEPRRAAVLSEFFRTGESYSMEFRIRGVDGSYRWKSSRGVAVRDAQGHLTRYFGTVTDIHDQRVAQEALRQAQKFESIGLLAGGIAHDFNNLLTGIIGNASMVKSLLPYGTPTSEMVQRVIQSGEQAAHLTRQLLAYAGKGRFVVQRVNLTELIREAAPLIQSSIPKSIALRLELKPDISAVETDPSQMQQVFMNLAINAAEAIGDGAGVISVSTGETTVDARIANELDGSGIERGRYVFLDVRDTGSGMDEATKARIFDPFFTTKFQGRGLGLAAVAGIVRAHRGAIQVTSTPGAGADIRVLLPAAESPGTEAIAPEQPSENLRGTGTVLFVDDEEVIRELAEGALTGLGYEVLVAASGAEAIEVFRSKAGRISMVVLDLSMPGMSGQETLPHLRLIRPDVKVVVSSGYSEAEALGLFRGARVSGFIQKPYTVQDLARKVKAVMA
jgi:PAS domain S-box-containing protein